MKLKVLTKPESRLKEETWKGDSAALLDRFLQIPLDSARVFVFENSKSDWLQVAIRNGQPDKIVFRRNETTSFWAELSDISREQVVPALRLFAEGKDDELRTLHVFSERKATRTWSQKEIDRSLRVAPWWKRPYIWLQPKPTLESAFAEGAVFYANRGRRAAMFLADLGAISFPSGRVAPKDPMMSDIGCELDRQIPRTQGKIEAAVARFDSGDERVAFVRIRFTREIARRHKLALRLNYRGHESWMEAYPVDSGNGGFIDFEAQAAVEQMLETQEDPAIQALYADLESRRKNTWSWANVEMLPGIRLLVVSSGWGDGGYSTYYGLNDADEVISLVTDFEVF